MSMICPTFGRFREALVRMCVTAVNAGAGDGSSLMSIRSRKCVLGERSRSRGVRSKEKKQ